MNWVSVVEVEGVARCTRDPFWFPGSPDDGLNTPLYVWKKFNYYKVFRNRIPVFRVGKSVVKIYPNPLKIALQYKEMLDLGQAESQVDLARILGVSRAKVTQMINLLELDEEIQEFILGLEDSDERLKVLTERRLRQISKIIDSEHQKDEFLKIIKA